MEASAWDRGKVLTRLAPLKMSYEAAKKRAEPYTTIVEELPQMRREAVQLAQQAVSEGRRAYAVAQPLDSASSCVPLIRP